MTRPRIPTLRGAACKVLRRFGMTAERLFGMTSGATNAKRPRLSGAFAFKHLLNYLAALTTSTNFLKETGSLIAISLSILRLSVMLALASPLMNLE